MVRNNFQQNLKFLLQMDRDGKYPVSKVVINFIIDEGNVWRIAMGNNRLLVIINRLCKNYKIIESIILFKIIY